MKKIFLVFFITLLFFSADLVIAGGTGCPPPGQGLVPCGNVDTCPCQLCDLFVLFQRVINFILFDIVPPVAILMIAIGGGMYIFAPLSSPETLAGGAGGGPKMLSQAKHLLTSVVFGLLIIYGAWIFVNTFLMLIGISQLDKSPFQALPQNWWKIPCGESVSVPVPSAPSAPTSIPSPTPAPPAPTPTPAPASPPAATPTPQTLWDTMSQQRKDNMTQSVAKGFWRNMPYTDWAETRDGNLILKMPGYAYYKLSKDELNILWNLTIQEAEEVVKESAQSSPPGSLLEVKTDLVQFTGLMAVWIEVDLKKEKISYNEAKEEIIADNVDPFSYFLVD